MAKQKNKARKICEADPVASDPSVKKHFWSLIMHIRKNVKAKASAGNTDSEPTSEVYTVPKLARRMRPKRREKVCRVLGGNDIKYLGPLSYRALRIIAWIICAVSVGGLVLCLAYSLLRNRLLPVVNDIGQTLSALSNYALPLFMLANFAVILNGKKGFRRLLITYTLCAILVCLCAFVVTEHYIVGGIAIFTKDRASARSILNDFFTTISYGYYSFNIFIDLLLCTLLTFFLTYRPKRIFKGKLYIVFRLFTILPILYELGCMALKILAGMQQITLPVYVWPLLTTKPPVIFMIFLAIAIFIKNRERSFRASGFSHKEYLQYQKTNRNSLQFSVYVCLIFIIFSILDVLMLIILPLIFSFTVSDLQDAAQVKRLIDVVNHIGVGKGTYLFLLAPFTLLFSYTRTHKNAIVDLFIPIGGVIFVTLFTVELIFEMIRLLPNL